MDDGIEIVLGKMILVAELLPSALTLVTILLVILLMSFVLYILLQ